MDIKMTLNTVSTAKMFWTLVFFMFLLSKETTCEPQNMTCAKDEDVTTLNGIVISLTGTLQGILGDSSIPMHQSVSTILNMVCNDQMSILLSKDSPGKTNKWSLKPGGLYSQSKSCGRSFGEIGNYWLDIQEDRVRQLVDGIEQDIGMCPELVQLTNVTSLVLGPLTFLDLLEKFQGVSHFCECMPALLQVLAIEDMKPDILYSDPVAKYTKVVNLTVICMKTTPSPPVNFTQAVILIGQNRQKCSTVLNYTSVNILDMESFIMNDCEEYKPDNFSCAMTHTQDVDFNDCLEQVEKQVTEVSDMSRSSDVKACRRAACVREHMNECQDAGTEAYMLAVNFHLGEREFQPIPCEDSAATSAPSLVLTLLTIISVLRF